MPALDNDYDYLNSLFVTSVFATEEAILNSMVAAENMTGHNRFSVKALPYDRLREIMRQYNRLQWVGPITNLKQDMQPVADQTRLK